MQRRPTSTQISQIERSFHEAISKKDIDQMVSLFAPNATVHVRPRADGDGKEQDPAGLVEQVGWVQARDALVVRTIPHTSSRSRVDGDRGTLHFECHFIDVDTGKVAAVTAGNLDVAKIDGRWLITNFVGSTSELEDLSTCRSDGRRRSRTQQPVRRNAGC